MEQEQARYQELQAAQERAQEAQSEQHRLQVEVLRAEVEKAHEGGRALEQQVADLQPYREQTPGN